MIMARQRHSRKIIREVPELNITTFLNLMVVLIPFLLISAVFSRITIMELSVPTGAAGSAFNTPNFAIEVIVRAERLEIANGRFVEATIPKKDGQYDINRLSEMLTRLKAQYPEKEDATVLMEPDIEYDYLSQIRDAVRGAERRQEGNPKNLENSSEVNAESGSDEVAKIVLFPNISIGDAP